MMNLARGEAQELGPGAHIWSLRLMGYLELPF